ncbi:lipopolysaccharide biosynthesis protein [Candidatus Pacearchaeota archaeon]|nr:lipopolysaccharide biosynthesis protein [Candidatus Pacearchaeota archaeon]
MTILLTIDDLTPPEKSLSQRAITSGAWVFLLRVIQQLFSLARLMILARILAPHDFGLMGIALLSMATLETFSQTGFQQALIQKKHDIKPYLDTAWSFLILRGVILFAILYLIAPYAATFFDAPEAKPIIQVIGLSVIFQAFTNIGVIHFQKELEFNKQFIYQLSGTLIDFIVAIVAVLILGNIWALVFGLLAGNVAMLITSYLIHPYRPHLNFNIGKAKELIGYGKWILGSSVLVFLVTQGDDILVGKLLGVTALGFYQMAYRISNLPATQITHVISQVSFPVYSKIQDDIPRLRAAYLNFLQLTALISFPIAGLIFVLAPDFTMIFLGEKWMPIVPAMQILVFAGLIRSIMATTGPIFQAIGQPKIETRWQIVRLLILVVLIYPFIIKWGILGASIIVLLSTLISTIGFSYHVINITKCGLINFFKCITIPAINTTFVIFIIIVSKYTINYTNIWTFLLNLSLGLLTALFLTYKFNKILNYKTNLLIRNCLNNIK